MSFREIIAELPNLSEDEKRELLGLLAQELSHEQESPEFLAMLQARVDTADREAAAIPSQKRATRFKIRSNG
jgi:hypothetical protein